MEYCRIRIQASTVMAVETTVEFESEKDEFCLLSWGANSYGQLGNGHKDDVISPSNCSLEPQTAGELVQLTGGGGHTTLLTSRGRLLVCGWNKNGQLAVQPYEDVTALCPAPPDLPTISKVSCGWTHTLAVSAAGRVVAWGCNTYSQLGLEREGEEEEGGRKTAGVCGPREIEVGVFGGEAVRDVAAGLRHSLVVTKSGRVYSWGDGRKGQLGHGDNKTQPLPKSVAVLEGQCCMSVAAGMYHSMALTDQGEVLAWGLNNHGQCAVDPVPPDTAPHHQPTPTSHHPSSSSTTLPPPATLPSGCQSKTATISDSIPSLIYSTTTESISPSSVSTLPQSAEDSGRSVPSPSTASVSSEPPNERQSTLCSTTSQHSTTTEPEIPDQSKNDSDSSLRSTGSRPPSNTQSTARDLPIAHSVTVAVAAHNNRNCTSSKRSDREKVVWLPRQVGGIPPIAEVHCGWSHSLAVSIDRCVFTWGRGDYGQLGRDHVMPCDPTGSSVSCNHTPSEVPELRGVRQVACGSEHNIAITADGSLVSFGWNEHGMCGTGSENNVPRPLPVLAGSPEKRQPGERERGRRRGCEAVRVGAGAGHTLALVKMSLSSITT